ncbi:hypothetical protein L208DRAFT_1382029 [Tricholoma matsutake]|nr:hypothetical protein L208DRAFT_1382029 [Tricholoma matsutake 945]
MLDWMELTEEEATHRKDIHDRTCTHIGNWYQHHYKKVASMSGNKVQEILQSMHEMATAKHPKKHAVINLYSDRYYKTCMKEKFDKLWATASQTLPRSARIQICKTFIDECWKKEQVEFREELEKEMEETYKAEMKAFQNGMTAMEDSASTLIPFADAISQHLGVYVAVMMVGPLNDGKVGVRSVHLSMAGGCKEKMWPEYDCEGFSAAESLLTSFANLFFCKVADKTLVVKAQCNRQKLSPDEVLQVPDGIGDWGGENQRGGGVMVPDESFLYPDESMGEWELHISWPSLSKAGANSMLIFLLLLAWWGQAMGEGRCALDGQESWKKAVEQVTRALQNVKVFVLQSREDGGTMEDDSMPKAAHALGSKSRKRGKSKGNQSVEQQPSKKKRWT